MKRLGIDFYIEFCCHKLGVQVADIKSVKRHQPLSANRFVIIWFLRNKVRQRFLFREIGAALNRDHPTLVKANQVVKDYLSINDKVYTELTNKLVPKPTSEEFWAALHYGDGSKETTTPTFSRQEIY